MRRFRIHPSVGIARVGNSPEDFFIGPERPFSPANSKDGSFESFRDSEGRIKRQAARFRVFEYLDDGAGVTRAVEVKLGDDIVDIEWCVHLANRKASFFSFNGQSGADDLYVKRASTSPEAIEKAEDPVRLNFRNAGVGDRRRERLDLDPGEQVVSVAAKGPVVLANPNGEVPFIPDLGRIEMTDDGHLLVLGGHGLAGSTSTPPFEISEYANNDTWFDDVGDGPVKARVRLKGGEVIDADAAWVNVGPPDFAPSISNAVSLYDLMWDLAVRELPAPAGSLFRLEELGQLVAQKERWSASGGRSLEGYEPSFNQEIYPILARALAARDLHDPAALDKASYHVQLINYEQLGVKDSNDPTADGLRKYIFGRIRNPSSKKIDWRGMPRGLGDLYDHDRDAGRFLSFTPIQYALLEQWANGRFKADWDGGPRPANEITPAGLDRAALESCVGGPFFPGIEVSWLIRRAALYSEPFRLDIPRVPLEECGPPKPLGALSFGPGFFSQQMAQPWHADFFDCHKEEAESREDNQVRFYMWWTAQRPDDTYAPGAETQAPWVRHIVPAGQSLDEIQESNERFRLMVANWSQLPFVLPKDDRLEEERR